MITQQILKELLNYNPETGIWSWRLNRKGVRCGSEAGWINDSGYVLIGLDGRIGRSYRAHRLAWLWMTGKWPSEQVDHKNGVRHDNRWENLREATREINCQNLRTAKSHNRSTGVLGVVPSGKRFSAKIAINRETHHLGTFDTTNEAHAAYVAAKRRLHPGCTI